MVELRPTLPGDCWLVLSNLRPLEVAELVALGVDSEQCVRFGLMSGNAQTGFIDGEPAGIFGVVDYGEYQVPWAVFTTAIDRHPLAFLRAARCWAKTLTGTVINYVDVRNERAVKWFRWLGFELSEPIPYGLNGELFRQVRTN